jgi:hypothetical protein
MLSVSIARTAESAEQVSVLVGQPGRPGSGAVTTGEKPTRRHPTYALGRSVSAGRSFPVNAEPATDIRRCRMSVSSDVRSRSPNDLLHLQGVSVAPGIVARTTRVIPDQLTGNPRLKRIAKKGSHGRKPCNGIAEGLPGSRDRAPLVTATEIILQFGCALTLASVSSYIGGRVHQQRRGDDQRRTAFREGFLRASTTLALVGGGERVAPKSRNSGTVHPIAAKALPSPR